MTDDPLILSIAVLALCGAVALACHAALKKWMKP